MKKPKGKIAPIVVSFKQNEGWISDYAREHNSPSAWIKDLITKEYKREKEGMSIRNTSIIGANANSLFDD